MDLKLSEKELIDWINQLNISFGNKNFLKEEMGKKSILSLIDEYSTPSSQEGSPSIIGNELLKLLHNSPIFPQSLKESSYPIDHKINQSEHKIDQLEAIQSNTMTDSMLLKKALQLLGMDETQLIEYEESELNIAKNIAKMCVYGRYGSHQAFYNRVMQEGIVYYWLHYEGADQYFDSAGSYLKALYAIECYKNGDMPICSDAEKIMHRLSYNNPLNIKTIQLLESKSPQNEVYAKICNLDSDNESLDSSDGEDPNDHEDSSDRST